MGLEFIDRIIRTSLIVAALVTLLIAAYYTIAFADGFFIGALWSCLNLKLLTALVVEATTQGQTKKLHLLTYALIKFPLLYLSGYLILRSGYFSIPGLMTGFSLIFVVGTLKALGRLILGMDTIKSKIEEKSDRRR